MRPLLRAWRKVFVLIGASCPFALAAQSIAFVPANPNTGESITATFSEPFDCAAPQPVLVTQSADSLTFESVLPNGIVNCPVVPFPPPRTSQFELPLGALPAGTYTVSWNLYRAQSSGPPQLLSSATATLTVTAARPEGVAVVSTPALSAWAALLLAMLCPLLALRRWRSRRGLRA